MEITLNMFYIFYYIFKLIIFWKLSVKSSSVSKILSAVKFHAPFFYTSGVDFKLLYENGINPKLPVYKITHLISFKDFLNLKCAQKEYSFNIVFIVDKVKDYKKLKRFTKWFLEDTNIFLSDLISLELLTNINKLNINYKSDSNYVIKKEKNGFSFNGTVLQERYKDFYFESLGDLGFCNIKVKEFLGDGTNYEVEILGKESGVLNIDFVYLLAPAAYLFKKDGFSIVAENIKDSDKLYLNFNKKPNIESYSLIDGLEHSTKAKFGFTYKFNIKKDMQIFLNFNIGNEKKSMKKSNFELYQKSVREFFSFKIKTHSILLNDKVNYFMPRQIMLSLLNKNFNFQLFKEYMEIKNSAFEETENGLKLVGNGIFKNLSFVFSYKECVFEIDRGEEKSVNMLKTIFKNISFIPYEVISKEKHIKATLQN